MGLFNIFYCCAPSHTIIIVILKIPILILIHWKSKLRTTGLLARYPLSYRITLAFLYLKIFLFSRLIIRQLGLHHFLKIRGLVKLWSSVLTHLGQLLWRFGLLWTHFAVGWWEIFVKAFSNVWWNLTFIELLEIIVDLVKFLVYYRVSNAAA